MARIITIETSGGICSVALAIDSICVALKEATGNQYTHSLTLYIEELLKSNGLDFKNDIDAVAVSAGPGSYTGLRIGVSTAKGLCFASQKPLISIDTLDALTSGALEIMNNKIDPKIVLVPMIDARRMEIYTAQYNYRGMKISQVQAMVVDQSSFAEYQRDDLLFFGSGAQKCAEVLDVKTIDISLSARWLCTLAEEKFTAQAFEDVAYFEPSYLKEFIALTSSKPLF